MSLESAGPNRTPSPAVLLTGATGFLGREILYSLLRAGRRVYCLIRAKSRAGAEARMRAVLDAAPQRLGPERELCTVAWGDISRPTLFDEPEVGERIAAEVDRIIHCAAAVQFDQPLADAREVNVQGTAHVLNLARRIVQTRPLARFDYIGTCFVAGRAKGVVRESDLTDAHGFHNSYEQTKYEAEVLVRAARAELPICILRPSIVVGDSGTGHTSAYNVLYWPMRVLASGLAVVVPANRKSVTDVVPVDYVVAAIDKICSRPETIGGCYQLAAGPKASSTFGELLDMGADFFKVRRPWVLPPETASKVLRPLLWLFLRGSYRRAFQQADVYFPYFSYHAQFDTREAEAILRPAGIEVVTVASYFRRLMEFCQQTDWGRRAPKPSGS